MFLVEFDQSKNINVGVSNQYGNNRAIQPYDDAVNGKV